MKNTKLWITVFGVLTLAAGLAGCGGATDEQPEVAIGYFNNVTHAQALYMKAEGVLEETFSDTASVTWTAFNAGPAEVEALFSGNIDIGYIGPVPAISANVKSDGDVSILCGATLAGAELIQAKGAGIESAADLDGKVVAIPQIGNTQHLCLLKLLADNGLSTIEEGGTVTVTAVENADVLNMMEQGNIDAAVVPEPWGSTLVENGAEIVLDYDELYMEGDYPVAVVVVRKEFMEEYPELVTQFLEAHESASVYINDNIDTAADIINEEINAATSKSLDKDILQSAFEKIKVSSLVNEEAVLNFADISLSEGFIDKLPDDTLFTSID